MEALISHLFYFINFLVNPYLKVFVLHFLFIDFFYKRSHLIIKANSLFFNIFEMILSPLIKTPFSLYDIQIFCIRYNWKFNQINYFGITGRLRLNYFQLGVKFLPRLRQKAVFLSLIKFLQKSIHELFFSLKVLRRTFT